MKENWKDFVRSCKYSLNHKIKCLLLPNICFVIHVKCYYKIIHIKCYKIIHMKCYCKIDYTFYIKDTSSIQFESGHSALKSKFMVSFGTKDSVERLKLFVNGRSGHFNFKGSFDLQFI